MTKHLKPNNAFPDEVLDLHRDEGVPLPTWYAGPLYTGNGTGAALDKLQEARAAASVPPHGPSVEAEPTGH